MTSPAAGSALSTTATWPRSQPSEEELVAILATVQLAWPRPIPPPPEDEEPANPWRFSGRWWARPVTARRARPWVERGF